MKASIIKLVCSSFAIMILFASCLGDNGGNSYEVTKDFAYITLAPDGKTKCAATSNGYVKSPAISNLILGQCYFLGYKITSSQTGGVYDNAEDVGQPTQLYLYQSREVSSIPALLNEFYPEAFAPLPYWNAREHFANIWPFAYKALLKRSDYETVHFYYDQSNQKEVVDGVSTAIGKNCIIIDVRFTKTSLGDDVEASETLDLAANLSQVKQAYSNSVNYADKEEAIVAIKFRYLKSTGKTTPPQETLIGSWEIENGAQGYGFIYTQK